MHNFLKKIRYSLIYRIRFLYFKLTNYFWNFLTKILISNKREMIKKKSVYIWVPVWGERHILWFFKYTLNSLLQDENLPLVSKTKYLKICFYTKDKDVSFIVEKMKNHICNYDYSVNSESEFNDQARDLMSNFFIHILNDSIENNALVLLAQPDLIFSNGSVFNMVTLSEEKGVSIAAPSARISFEYAIESNDDLIFEAEDLTSFITRYPHKSLKFAYEDDSTNATLGGISTKKILGGLAVIHNLPPVFLCNPTKSDLNFFKRRPSFNIIDKVWPDMLFRQSRLKIIGSSDIATIVELTKDDEKNIETSSDMRLNDFYPAFPPFMNHSNVIVGLWRSK